MTESASPDLVVGDDGLARPDETPRPYRLADVPTQSP